MSKGKYYSLEEARRANDLEGFSKTHPSRGDRSLFNKLLSSMTKKPAAKGLPCCFVIELGVTFPLRSFFNFDQFDEHFYYAWVFRIAVNPYFIVVARAQQMV